MDPAYGERYRTLFRQHWWWRAREVVVRRALERAKPEGGWRRALDVGCGDGLFLDALGEYSAHVEGLEPDERLLSEATRTSGRVHIAPFDVRFRPEQPYDLLLFLDVVEHIEDASGTLAHAAELLEPGGALVITAPAFLHLWTAHDTFNQHRTRYTKRRLRLLLSQHFVIDEIRYFFRWVYGAKLIQRATEALRPAEPDLPAIPPAPVNQLLFALSPLDELLFSRLPLPFGSSILAVAHKAP